MIYHTILIFIVYKDIFNIYKLNSIVHIKEFCVLIQDACDITLICYKDVTISSDIITSCSNDWVLLKIDDILNFFMYGFLPRILTEISSIGVSVFVISAFETDYILIPNSQFKETLQYLQSLGHKLIFEGGVINE